MAADVYCLAACCCAFFFLAVGGGLLGGGTAMLNNADAKDYRAADCFVSSFSYRQVSGSSSRRRRGGRLLGTATICDYQLTTSLTENRAWEWKGGGCTYFAEDVASCRITPPLNCSGSCYVVYESEAADAEPIEVKMASVEVVGTFFGLLLTAMGSMSFCMSSAFCFCMRLMSLAESDEGLESSVKPMNIGAPQGGDAAHKKSPIDTAKFKHGMSGCFSFTGTLLTFFAVVGVIGGIYVAAVLKYFHNRELSIGNKVLPAEAATVGFGVSGLCVVCILLVWLGICVLKKKFRKLLEEYAAAGASEQEMQRMFAQKVIDKLRSGEGERFRKMLLEAGIGEEQIERMLTAPPDQIINEALILLTGRLMAHIVCTLGEESLRPPFEQQLAIFSITFLGFPAVLVAVVLWTSAFCVQFAQPSVASVVSLFMIISCGALHLQWMKTYLVGFSALNFAFWAVIFALWAQHGVTGLSVLLWLLSMPQFAVWSILTSIWACYLKPIAEALFEFGLEAWKAEVWRCFGCERDPEHLRKARAEVLAAGGCLAERLGLRELIRGME